MRVRIARTAQGIGPNRITPFGVTLSIIYVLSVVAMCCGYVMVGRFATRKVEEKQKQSMKQNTLTLTKHISQSMRKIASVGPSNE